MLVLRMEDVYAFAFGNVAWVHVILGQDIY